MKVQGMLYLHGRNVNNGAFFAFPDTIEMRRWHYPKHEGNFEWTLTDHTGKVIDKYRKNRR